MTRTHVGLAGAFLLTAVGGFFAGKLATEEKIRKEYEESARAYRRAMELVKVPEGTAPEETEEDLETNTVVQRFETDQLIFDVKSTDYGPAPSNPYHTAMAATETPVKQFVEGGVNDYGISYIEEDEFLEDDGRYKGHITFVMDAYNPTFFLDGEKIDDWDQRLGDSIVVDFTQHVPPGVNPVLYVRNHKTDEDYEVTAERP